ncbi:MAG: hypothetical protein PVG78_00765 [Desulfobacterales bacterium]|jgi:hypothetical protein
MKTSIRLFAALVLAGLLAGCAGTATMDPEAALRKRIGEAYGVSGFDRIDALRYTFNMQLKGRTVIRSWVWEPGTDRVVLQAEDGGADYQRNEVGESSELRAVDARFVNDNYWLLFPLHVYWDINTAVSDTGMAKLPIGPGEARRIVVSYPRGARYSPGDVYELFLDDRFRVQEWIYRKGGAAKPTRVATWEDHRRLGPLTVSLTHRSADGSFRLWFTDVGVKLKGEKLWTEPTKGGK